MQLITFLRIFCMQMEMKNRITNITCDWRKKKKRLTHLSSEKGPGNLLHKYAAWGDKHIGWESGLLEFVVHWQHTGKEQREKWWEKRKKDARFLKAATFYQFMYRNHQKGLNLYFCRTGKQNNGGSVTYFNDFFLPVLDLSYLILWKGNPITLDSSFQFYAPCFLAFENRFPFGKKRSSHH